MGNKLSVDKLPSPIENIINFPIDTLPSPPEDSIDNTFQHLNLWQFSEVIPEKINEEIPSSDYKDKSLISQNQIYNSLDQQQLNANSSTIINQNQRVKSIPIELSNIHKTHFLLSGNNVYILLLIFKKEKENFIEQSSFPTGLWGIIESSSNMTPRGLLYAFPANNNDISTANNNSNQQNQNLESFLLSKRDFADSEFKYMLFIWNGKSSSALLRSYSLMKAFDLDKALSSPKIVPFIYNGYFIDKDKVEKKDSVKLNEIINNTVENNEEMTPSSEKISNYHETVYLLKFLYPINNANKKEKKSNKKVKVCFGGFNRNFITTQTKLEFYSNFKSIEFNKSNTNRSENNNKNCNDITKSQISKSLNKNKQIVMPPKLNLNLNLNNNNNNISNNNSKENSKDNNNINNLKINEELNNESNNSNQNCNNNEEQEYTPKDDEDDDSFNEDEDLDTNLINSSGRGGQINNNNPSHIIMNLKIPKLIVTKQNNVLNEELISQRSKKKSEEEDSLNEIPESTLIKTSEKILNETDYIQSINNNDEIDINALNEDYNLKDAERKKIISDYYSKHLSEIIPGFLYLSSYNAAKNKELLEKYKISYIINCAADFCQNVFEDNQQYKYLSFYLKDHVLENVECIFYECIDFIEKAKEKNGVVLIHCIQGISRSVSIVIAYLIYKNKYNYDTAFNYVQSKRAISSPNFGFSIQLQNFYLRLFESPENYRYIPKIFAVGSFQAEQQQKIVCRLMNEPFFENKENGQPRLFDKRGLFIIVTLTNIYIWIGKKISNLMKDTYLNYAMKYIKLLQVYEHAPTCNGTIINDGEENESFLKELLITNEKILKFKNHISDEFNDWNNWYKEVPPIVEEKKANNDEIKKAFFLYPNLTPDYVLDFDDLNDNQFLIACVSKKDKHVIYRWKGTSNELSDNDCNNYKNQVVQFYYNGVVEDNKLNEIEVLDEIPMEESDDFLNLL